MKSSVLTHHTFRFMLGYVSCLSIAVFILLLTIFLFYAEDYLSQINKDLENELDKIASAYQQSGRKGVAFLQQKNKQTELFDHFAFIIVDSNKVKIVGDLKSWPSFYQWSNGWLTFELSVKSNLTTKKYFFIARERILANGETMLVAINGGGVKENIILVSNTLFWGMVIMSLLGLFGALIVSYRNLSRIEVINHVMDRFIEGDLSKRVPLNNPSDGFNILVNNLNAMLTRVQANIDDLRTVSDNIAHDLKTPLTIIRNKLTLIEDNPSSTKPAFVSEIIHDADRLLSIFNSILRISRIETGAQKSAFKKLELSSLLEQVVDLYLPLAQEKAIQVDYHSSSSIPLVGDADLLFQMFANLVDNAIKYLPHNGIIKIQLFKIEGCVWVYIADNGEGISAKYRSEVLKRFYRINKNRPKGDGNGLGLSFVKAVVELHKGEISLSSSQQFFQQSASQGLTVKINLPGLL